jgi:hypothetical protein
MPSHTFCTFGKMVKKLNSYSLVEALIVLMVISVVCSSIFMMSKGFSRSKKSSTQTGHGLCHVDLKIGAHHLQRCFNRCFGLSTSSGQFTQPSSLSIVLSWYFISPDSSLRKAILFKDNNRLYLVEVLSTQKDPIHCICLSQDVKEIKVTPYIFASEEISSLVYLKLELIFSSGETHMILLEPETTHQDLLVYH